MKREETRAFQVGNLTLGGNNHVIIQSMTNTKTKCGSKLQNKFKNWKMPVVKWSEWLFLTRRCICDSRY